MGLSAFNAMRARQKAREKADGIKQIPFPSIPETSENSSDNEKSKKRTDAEKLKTKKD